MQLIPIQILILIWFAKKIKFLAITKVRPNLTLNLAKKYKPSCIIFQETNLPKKNVFKLNEYQVFQKNRNGSGGGLLTAVDPILNPMLISTKNEEAEILTVQLVVNNQNIRLINGYGPHEDDKYQNKLNFWMGLDQEIVSAKSESCLVMIQMDANAKVGRKIISADPNVMDNKCWT